MHVLYALRRRLKGGDLEALRARREKTQTPNTPVNRHYPLISGRDVNLAHIAGVTRGRAPPRPPRAPHTYTTSLPPWVLPLN